MAYSSKLFQTLAISIFKRKFGTTKFSLNCFGCGCRNHREGRVNQILICGFELIFRFLRVFGGEISKLDVHYHDYIPEYGEIPEAQLRYIDCIMWHVDEYINNYCAGTLSSIKFTHKMKFSNYFVKPFQMIEKVCIKQSNLNDEVLYFAEWFPNMHFLEMTADIIDNRLINVTLPRVKHLMILFTSFSLTDDKATIAMQNVGEFLKSNQQLESVEVSQKNYFGDSGLMTVENLLDMIEGNPMLSKLVFDRRERSSQYGTNVTAGDVNRIVREHSQLVELEIKSNHNFDANDAITLMRQLNSLKQFRFDIRDEQYNKFTEQLDSVWQYTSKRVQCHYSIDLHRK